MVGGVGHGPNPEQMGIGNCRWGLWTGPCLRELGGLWELKLGLKSPRLFISTVTRVLALVFTMNLQRALIDPVQAHYPSSPHGILCTLKPESTGEAACCGRVFGLENGAIKLDKS